jgi:hypothetical protein
MVLTGGVTIMKKIPIAAIASLLLLTAPFQAQVYADSAVPAGYEEIAKSADLTLYADLSSGAVAVLDGRNGHVWLAVVDSSVYDIDQANPLWKNYMKSMLALSYTDLKRNDGTITKIYSFVDAPNPSVKKTAAGITVTYDFKNAGIAVTLEIKLEGDTLSVRTPAAEIVHRGDAGIARLEVMPFLGAAGKETDGYIFFPDGAGAIMRYEGSGSKTQMVKAMSWNIYDSEDLTINEFMQTQRQRAMLPVYGIKNDSGAMLAACTAGAEDTKIYVYPDGFGVNLNRAFFEFNYRHFFTINLSDITVNGRGVSKFPAGLRADKNIIETDRDMRFFFLAGEDACYSGMANVYREYLLENGLLNRAIARGESIPLGLDLFMGVKEERLLFDKFISMTTFDNAKEISGAFKAAGVENVEMILKGWTKGGYGLYPIQWPPDGRLGGRKGLVDFAKYAEAGGIRLYLQNDFLLANVRNGGFSTRKDVVMNGAHQPVTRRSKDLFILNPFSAVEKYIQFMENSSGVADCGVAFDNIGKHTYHDYNKSRPADTGDAINQWVEMLKDAAGTGRNAAVDGGNLYCLRYAQRLYNIPIVSSELRGSDETVPFYQMVVHGSIPYTAEPGNLSYDIGVEKLKWVEYGCMPYFELTFRHPVELNYTVYKRLFSSYWEDWIKQAAGIYQDFNERLSGLWQEKMLSHEKMGDKLYKTVYSNGTTVYINYSDEPAECDGRLIAALDFEAVDREGVRK